MYLSRFSPLPLLLLLSCQSGPDAQALAARLQRRVAVQQDSLRRLRGRAEALQQELIEVAAAANALPAVEPAGPVHRGRATAASAAGQLYRRPVITELRDAELAEVLSIADSTSRQGSESYDVKAYRVCNGPGDRTLDYCTCSHYVYLALGTYDLPNEYRLVRIGPFYQARFAGWTKAPNDQLTLRIRHDLRGRPQTDSFRISWTGVRQL